MAHFQEVLKNVATGATVKIVCLGDSITFMNYPENLQTILRTFFNTQAVTVVNSGVAGNTSVDILARMGAVLAAETPDLVILGVGQNDSNPANGISTTAFKNNLNTIMDNLAAYPVAILGVSPRYAPFTNKGEDSCEFYRQTLRRIAAQRDAAYVDTFAAIGGLYRRGGAVRSTFSPDGVHYDAAGQWFLASLVFHSIFSSGDLSIRKCQTKDFSGQWFRLVSGTANWSDGTGLNFNGTMRLTLYVDDGLQQVTLHNDGAHDLSIGGVSVAAKGCHVPIVGLSPGVNFFEITSSGNCKITGLSTS